MPSPYTVSIAGTTFDGRQEILASLFTAQQEIGPLAATLEREPKNAYDPNAVKVLVSGRQVGYLPGFLAAKIAPRMDAGEVARVTALEITHGVDSYRAKITIEIPTKEAI